MHSVHRLAAIAAVVIPFSAAAAEPAGKFRPDPVSVQRFGTAYRYPQAGWIVLHIEGSPYERGEQHGRLLAPEIVDYVRSCAAEYGSKSPEQAWRIVRTMVNALFVRQFEQEFLEEMKGIADGAAAAGAKFDGRPIDLTDIVALNCWPEIETLDDAVEALPTGLEGKRFGHGQPKRMPAPAEGHCSAFAATGPATADGQVVFGHITMWNLRLARFFNVWLDVQPVKGHRVLLQSFPGGIQSGTDYYMNSAGLLVTETTIRQTRFDVKGFALAGRIRKVLQYADSIDAAVDILKSSNNGLYTNEWLLADTKTNEIAMFELGTYHNHLYRSSRGEWFGGTEGFYWGCNNTKDVQVRLETIPGVEGRPQNMVWRPTDRDKLWLKLYAENKGKITADFGRLAFTTPPLSALHSLDAKYTTSAMAKRLETVAVFGPPTGMRWEPTKEDKERDANVRPLVANSWTKLRPDRPADGGAAVAAVDLFDKVRAAQDDDKDPATAPAWHGTLLAKTDGDAWLAAAFAEYERIVALETALKKQSDGKLSAADKDRLAVALNAYQADYLAAVRRAGTDTPLSQIKQRPGDEWNAIAVGKGVLLLHDLRQAMGTEKFCDLMDSFGRANAGKEVTAAAFVERVSREPGNDWDQFFSSWLDKPGIPAVKAGSQTIRVGLANRSGHGGGEGGGYVIQGFDEERDRTLIVYGTADDEAANPLTAERLREAIRTHWSNQTLPVKSDRDVTDEDLRDHHLLLIGRPDTNRIVERFRGSWPVMFGWRSFAVRGETYANAGSAVITSAANPLNPRYSATVLAGLGAEATTLTTDAIYQKEGQGANVLILPHGGKKKAIVAAGEKTAESGAKSTR
jgi:hypothetical protein